MKKLSDIKFGQEVFDRLIDPDPVTYDQIIRSLGLAPKQLQKALADLCKSGYATKTDRGYVLVKRTDGQETTN